MSLPAASEQVSDALVLPLPQFRLRSGEPLGEGLQRLSLDQLETAVSGFYDGEEAFALAVHEARKATKRIRALLRLVRFEIGERAFLFENAAMRDTARLLSPVRSAGVMCHGVDVIRDMYGTFLAADTFGELADLLTIRRDRIEQRAMEDPELIPRVVTNLERAHARYASWPTNPEAREVYGIGIRDTFEAVGPGMRATYRQGRGEMVAASQAPTPVNIHSWRKRVKYLRYQLELLSSLWPEVLLGMALTLQRIGEFLGEDHDLADLLHLVTDRSDLCPNPVERSLLRALAGQRQSDLETASRILGRRIYTETPTSLNNRFEAFWESTRLARGFSLGAISY